MLLLGLIDTEQTTAMGVTEGYAMALDPAGDRLIIKSFHSDKDTHPLTGILRTETGKDDIEYDGPCFHFAKSFAEHYKEESVDQRLGFKLLVHDYVIKFFILHWDGLFKDRSRALGYSQEYLDNLEKEVEYAYYIVIDVLKRIKFPVIKKLGEAYYALNAYKKLERAMATTEHEFRQDALTARESGEEKIAENAAKGYEKLLGTVRAFNEDPTADV